MTFSNCEGKKYLPTQNIIRNTKITSKNECGPGPKFGAFLPMAGTLASNFAFLPPDDGVGDGPGGLELGRFDPLTCLGCQHPSVCSPPHRPGTGQGIGQSLNCGGSQCS